MFLKSVSMQLAVSEEIVLSSFVAFLGLGLIIIIDMLYESINFVSNVPPNISH